MNNIKDIENKLNDISKQFSKKKNRVTNEQTLEVVDLLVQLSQNRNAEDVAKWLHIFPERVLSKYFDEITRKAIIPLNNVEMIINSYISSKSSKDSGYNKKCAVMIIKVINNYGDTSYNSETIAKLITSIATNGLKYNNYTKQFANIVFQTEGKIYMVDFSSINKKDLNNINKITTNLSTNDNLKNYSDLIKKWSLKYGFISDSDITEPKTTNINNTSTFNKPNTDSNNASLKEKSSEKVKKNSKKISDSAITSNNTNNSDQVLYKKIKKDMDKEQEFIISALANKIDPIAKTIESIQRKIHENRKLNSENTPLKFNVSNLEKKLTEQNAKFQTLSQSFTKLKDENNKLKSKISTLESQNSELDSKLNDAYTINSRKSSLEAERIRLELKKEFSFLYEDWLEYESSNVSEENYESLQAIIKKMFRSLERNGIDFKGND